MKSLLGTWSKSRLLFLAVGLALVAFGAVSLLQH